MKAYARWWLFMSIVSFVLYAFAVYTGGDSIRAAIGFWGSMIIWNVVMMQGEK